MAHRVITLSWNIPMKKSNLQRLKKSKTFAFRNLPFTKQHNILLNGTKSNIFDRVHVSINNLTTCKAYQCDANNACRVMSMSDSAQST